MNEEQCVPIIDDDDNNYDELLEVLPISPHLSPSLPISPRISLLLEVRDEALAQTVTSVRRAMEEMQGVFAAFPLPRLPAEVRVGRDWAHMRPFDEHA